ncbi:MAG TPA: GNAT family protein [Gemmataceae bacterium]|nr:GNAT family protein [Gemmataceae bacterium]
MNPQPVTLIGRYVRLEPLRPAHAPDLFAALSVDPTIWRWWRETPPADLAGMEAFVNATLQEQAGGSVVAFAQVELASSRAVGSTTYMDIRPEDRGLEIGSTWLGKPWQRTGINTEAKYLLLRHAFEVLGAARVQLKTDARNVQSQTAIARLGAVREGVLRKHRLVRNGFLRDSVMFSIIDAEWPDVKARLERLMAAHGLTSPG